jgi:two-component system cell cycle response regulator
MRNNLLLILHNKTDRDTLSKNLQPNYNVFEAGSKEDARQVFEVISVQLIICGVDGTRTDGWYLCTQLKTSRTFSHIPVILMGNDDSLAAKIKSLDAGADAYISTSASWNYLNALIKNLIFNRVKVTEHIANSYLATSNHPDLIHDDDFIKKLHDQIAGNLHNCSLSVDLLARLMNMSRPTLYRKIKTITDLTPNDLINMARLKRAAELLGSADHKVFQVAKMVGFQTQSSFGKAFIKQFKITPTQYQMKKREAALMEAGRPGMSPQHNSVISF